MLCVRNEYSLYKGCAGPRLLGVLAPDKYILSLEAVCVVVSVPVMEILHVSLVKKSAFCTLHTVKLSIGLVKK